MKKYYNIRFGIYEDAKKQIKADDTKEARVLANELIEKFKKQLLHKKIRPQIELSDRNFRLDIGAIYLLRKYSKTVAAECTDSNPCYRYYKRDEFRHVFRYLDSGKTVVLFSKGFIKPKRLIRKLCQGGDITDKCNSCIARFHCFTNKKE